MTTQALPVRTLTAPVDGPVLLTIDLPDGAIQTVTEPGRARAEVVLTATGSHPALGDAIAAATMTADGTGLTVRVPAASTGTGPFAHVGGSTFTAINTGVITGMTITNGHVSFDGAQLDGDDVTTGGFGRLTVTARLPEESGIVATTRTADLDTSGSAKGVKFTSKSGGIKADRLRYLIAETTSGAISAQAAERVLALSTSGAIRIGRTLDIRAQTKSGAITIGDYTELPGGGTADLDTTSGAITLTATGPGTVTARSVTGPITITPGPHLNPATLTVHVTSRRGRVRTPGGHR